MVDVENKEQYVTIGQVAESAGVTIETVRRWDREGKLKSQGRDLRGWRYYLFTDVQQLLKDHLCCVSKNHPVTTMDPNTHELNVARALYLALQRGDRKMAMERCMTLQYLLNATE